MQIWNSAELLLVLSIIVLSLENNFKKPQMIIVLMKQMWRTAYVLVFCFVFKQQQRLAYRGGSFCFSVCSLSLFLEVQAPCQLSSKFGNLT